MQELKSRNTFLRRLSIWQQFSSNHSNDFTVVGKFAPENEAAKTAEMFNERPRSNLHAKHRLLWKKASSAQRLNLDQEYGFEWT